jgi:hypothetical protein
MELIIGIIIGCLVGLAIGQTRGRPLAGFFLGLLIGPIGWLLVFFGPNPKKKKEEEEMQALVNQQLARQNAQLQANQRMQSHAILVNTPQKQVQLTTIRIAKNGLDLGDFDIPKVKLMLRNGELTRQDYYYDTQCNDWMTIEWCPDLAI